MSYRKRKFEVEDGVAVAEEGPSDLDFHWPVWANHEAPRGWRPGWRLIREEGSEDKWIRFPGGQPHIDYDLVFGEGLEDIE